MEKSCKFCQICLGKAASYPVFEDPISLAILDIKPLFYGHVLLLPKLHIELLPDLPSELVGRFFENVRLLSKAIPFAMKSKGSFVAINNKVSQSVPHLHVHIVPRNPGDGLKGFFWPRQRNVDENVLTESQQAIIESIKYFQ